MAFEKVEYTDEQTMITAKNMNDIQDAILEQEKNANRMDVLAIGTKRQGSNVYDFTYSHTAEEVVNAYNSGALVSLTVRADGQEYATTVAEESGQVFFSPILETFHQGAPGKYVTFSADSEIGWGTYPGNGTASDLYLLPQFSRAQTFRYYVPMFDTQSNNLGFDSVNYRIDLGSTLVDLYMAAISPLSGQQSGENTVMTTITDQEMVSSLADMLEVISLNAARGRGTILSTERSMFAPGESVYCQLTNVMPGQSFGYTFSLGTGARNNDLRFDVDVLYKAASQFGDPASAAITVTCQKRNPTVV